MPNEIPMANQSANPPSIPIPILKLVAGFNPFASINVIAAAPAPKYTRSIVPTPSAMLREARDAIIFPPRMQHCSPGRAFVASSLGVFWRAGGNSLPIHPLPCGLYASCTSPSRRQYILPQHRCLFPLLHIHNISYRSPNFCRYPGIRWISFFRNGYLDYIGVARALFSAIRTGATLW